MPALSVPIAELSAASAITFFMTPSPVGERQMFPKQTKQTRTMIRAYCSRRRGGSLAKSMHGEKPAAHGFTVLQESEGEQEQLIGLRQYRNTSLRQHLVRRRGCRFSSHTSTSRNPRVRR